MGFRKGQRPAHLAHMTAEEVSAHMAGLSRAAWAKYTPEERHALAVARGIKQRHINRVARGNGAESVRGDGVDRVQLRVLLETALRLL